MHILDLHWFGQLRIYFFINCLFELIWNCAFSIVVGFCKIETVNRIRIFWKKLSKMPPGCFILWVVLILGQDDIWLFMDLGYLVPKQRNRSSYLHITRYLWFQIKLITRNITNLLYFHIVCHIPMHIDSSLHIPCSSISSRSPTNQDESTVFCFTFEIHLIDWSIYHRHHPLLLDQNTIEIFDKIMIPQIQRFKWLMLLQPFLLDAMTHQLCTHWLSMLDCVGNSRWTSIMCARSLITDESLSICSFTFTIRTLIGSLQKLVIIFVIFALFGVDFVQNIVL